MATLLHHLITRGQSLVSPPDGGHPLDLEVKAGEGNYSDVQPNEGHAGIGGVDGVVVTRMDSLAFHQDSTILCEKRNMVEIARAKDQVIHFFQGPPLRAHCVPCDGRYARDLLYVLRHDGLQWLVRVGEINSFGDGCDVQHDVGAREIVPNDHHCLVFERPWISVLVAVCDATGKALQAWDGRDERFAVVSAIWWAKRG